MAIHLQREGYRPFLLVGSATARMGDPSFREVAKARLDDYILKNNTIRIKSQLARLMHQNDRDSDGCSVQIVDNYEWQKDLCILDFLDEIGSKVRLNAMLGRDSIQRRLNSPLGLSYAEATYQLLQAYDFLHLYRKHGCLLQIGGSDQWGNIIAGVELIGRMYPEVAISGMTFPLITTAQGEKLGKSDGNALWLDAEMTSPFDLYQYFLRLSDDDALRWLSMLSLQPMEEIEEIKMAHKLKPECRLAQLALAKDVISFVHGIGIVKDVERASQLLFDQYDETIFADEKSIDLVAHMLKQSKRYLELPHDKDHTIQATLQLLEPENSKSTLLVGRPCYNKV